jgi:tetratricopeptide (TPR) repeat protein
MRSAYIALLAVALAFGQSETMLDRGIDEFHKGQYSEAQMDFERTLKLSPADARAITYLAITRAAFGDCAGSIEELRLQCHRNPDPEIRRLAGLAVIQCLLPHNQLGEIMPLMEQLRRSYSDDPDVLYESTQVYNRAWSAALRDVYQKAPNSYRANQISAEILETQGKYEEAASEYRKALERNPAGLHLHYRLGVVLLRASKPSEARAALEAELKLNPADPAAEYQIGQTLLAEQKSDNAALHFEKALEIAPKCADCMVALAKLKIDGQKYKDAIALLERAIELQPGLETAHRNLMLAYRGAGKNKQADREQAELNKLQAQKDR